MLVGEQQIKVNLARHLLVHRSMTNHPRTITGQLLYNVHNSKRSSPWELDITSGIESPTLGVLRSIRRHADRTFTVRGDQGTERSSTFTVND